MASPTVKRQRKRRRIDTDGDPEFQVAPMVDVLLVLMLFFMAITSTEVLKKDPKLELPSAKNAKKDDTTQHKHEIVVNVHWDDANSLAQFSLDGVNYATADSMQGVLQSQHERDPEAHVVIRADKSTEYSNISDLMAACASAGISTVSFSVLIGGNNNKQAPPAPGGTASN